MPARRIVPQSQTARTPPVPAQEISGDAGFLDEDVAARVVDGLRVLPLPPGRGDIRAPLFVGVYRFF